ncbi:hypothetical protein [Streptomyces violaceusniger]|uniref:hypothetical protein n=1 Tax=Streptomyces violaceusniger TaxID=68280 RepID=UPI0031D1D5A5
MMQYVGLRETDYTPQGADLLTGYQLDQWHVGGEKLASCLLTQPATIPSIESVHRVTPRDSAEHRREGVMGTLIIVVSVVAMIYLFGYGKGRNSGRSENVAHALAKLMDRGR